MKPKHQPSLTSYISLSPSSSRISGSKRWPVLSIAAMSLRMRNRSSVRYCCSVASANSGVAQPSSNHPHNKTDKKHRKETKNHNEHQPHNRIGMQEVIEIGEFIGGKRCREWHLWILKKDNSKFRMIRGREFNPPSSQCCARIARHLDLHRCIAAFIGWDAASNRGP